MEHLDIQASKIKCGGCVANIEKVLKDFSEITKVKVDIESNIVSIQGHGLNKATIENKLKEIGYPVL